MNKIPMLEKFAAQSLVELDGELVFSKEKFALLIVQECIDIAEQTRYDGKVVAERIKFVFGVEE